MAYRFRKKHAKPQRKTFAEVIREEFDYDVDALESYVDEQSPDIMEDLVRPSSGLKSRISVIENVKGSTLIKLKTSSPTLQAAATCGWTPEGGIVLTDVTLSTVRVKIQEEYCNEDLNATWAQIENAAGANRQDEEAPDFADTMIAYYLKRAEELDENLMWNGDTTSSDDNLVHYNGWLKQLKANGLVNEVHHGGVTIGPTNAFDELIALDDAVPLVVKSNRALVGYEILCGYEVAQDVLTQIYTDKDYSAKIDFVEENGTLTFILPTRTTRVRSIKELDGTQEVWGVPQKYLFYGTDLSGDMEDMGFKFNFHDERLRFGVKWRSGVAFVFPQYFTRLILADS